MNKFIEKFEGSYALAFHFDRGTGKNEKARLLETLSERGESFECEMKRGENITKDMRLFVFRDISSLTLALVSAAASELVSYFFIFDRRKEKKRGIFFTPEKTEELRDAALYLNEEKLRLEIF